jgi:hypothetical protein
MSSHLQPRLLVNSYNHEQMDLLGIMSSRSTVASNLLDSSKLVSQGTCKAFLPREISRD